MHTYAHANAPCVQAKNNHRESVDEVISVCLCVLCVCVVLMCVVFLPHTRFSFCGGVQIIALDTPTAHSSCSCSAPTSVSATSATSATFAATAATTTTAPALALVLLLLLLLLLLFLLLLLYLHTCCVLSWHPELWPTGDRDDLHWLGQRREWRDEKRG
jgi:hypothetical protein